MKPPTDINHLCDSWVPIPAKWHAAKVHTSNSEKQPVEEPVNTLFITIAVSKFSAASRSKLGSFTQFAPPTILPLKNTYLGFRSGMTTVITSSVLKQDLNFRLNFRTQKIYNQDWLVVWNIFYDFPYIGNLIIPTDELIFFRGVG